MVIINDQAAETYTDHISVCILSGVRLRFLLMLNVKDITCMYSLDHTPGTILDTDSHLDSSQYVIVWSTVEVHTAVISACLPTLRPLVISAMEVFSSLGPTIKTFGFSSKTATESKDTPIMNRKEPNSFHRLSDSTEEYPLVPGSARARFTSTKMEPSDLESGA